MNTISTDNFQFRKLIVPTTPFTKKNTELKNTLCYQYRFLDEKWHKSDNKAIEKITEPSIIIIFSDLYILQKASYLSNILTKNLKKDLQFIDKSTAIIKNQVESYITKAIQIIQESHRILDEYQELPLISCYIFNETNFYVLQTKNVQVFLERNESNLFRITTNQQSSGYHSTEINFFNGDSVYSKSKTGSFIFKTKLLFGAESIESHIKKQAIYLNIKWLIPCFCFLALLGVLVFRENSIDKNGISPNNTEINIGTYQNKPLRIDYKHQLPRLKKISHSQLTYISPIESQKKEILQRRLQLLTDSSSKEELDALTEEYIRLEKEKKRLEKEK